MPNITKMAPNMVDLSEYSNLDSIINRDTVQQNIDFNLFRDITKLGYDNSKSGIQFNAELAEYIDKWEKVVLRKNSCIGFPYSAYNTIESVVGKALSDGESKCIEEHRLAFMKQFVPVSYVIWGSVCLLFAAVFTTMMFYGVHCGIYLINPWINLALCVAAVGMTITVVIAMFEWRTRLDGKQKREK